MFDPKKRLTIEEVEKEAKQLLQSEYFSELLKDIPLTLFIINKYRQILYLNKDLFNNQKDNNFTGIRPGEYFNCYNSKESEYGCGASKFCKLCGLSNSVFESEEDKISEKEWNISFENGDSMPVYVTTRPFEFINKKYVFCTLQDLADKKLRENLEKIFLHDIANTVTGIYSYIQVCDSLSYEQFKELLSINVERLIDEIHSYKLINMSNPNSISENIKIDEIEISNLFKESIQSLLHIHIFSKKKIKTNITPEIIYTDKVLLRRIIINLLKNAFEASTNDEEIEINSFINEQNELEFSIKNQLVLPETIKMQIFKKSFSTKGIGRGFGTYSIKLLTEKYLKGKVDFISDEINKTVFTVKIPINKSY